VWADATFTSGGSYPYFLNGATDSQERLTMSPAPVRIYLSGWQQVGSAGTTSKYMSLNLTGLTGPISFTISDLDARTSNATTSGATYYTDTIQVTNNNAVIAPTSSSNLNTTAHSGWVTATTMGVGSVTYTIANPGTVTIKLANTYSGTIQSSAHPNQVVILSDISCVTT